MSQTNEQDHDRTSVLVERRPYRAPVLRRLGRLTEITQMLGTVGKNDGGHGNAKTG